MNAMILLGTAWPRGRSHLVAELDVADAESDAVHHVRAWGVMAWHLSHVQSP
jgi:hypothetical protein